MPSRQKKPSRRRPVRQPDGHKIPVPTGQEVAKTTVYKDFRSAASWRIFRIMAEFIEGFDFLSGLTKTVTFFGSARSKPNSTCYKEARRLAAMLGRAGFTVISGGGPGVMEASNRGAKEVGAESVGLNIELPREQRINPFVSRFMGFHYFFTRKVMLSASAQAYVFFPGGFGTMDEMMEILTLIQTGKMTPLPIVLVGREHWEGYFRWVRDNMVPNGYITEKEMDIFKIVDSAEEAFGIVKDSKERETF